MNGRTRFWMLPLMVTSLLLLTTWIGAPAAHAAACQSVGSGAWESAATWTNCNGGSPVSGDSAQILSGHTVTLGGGADAWWVDSTAVDSGGTLVLTRGIRNSSSFVVNGTLVIGFSGWVENVSPTYGADSLLQYSSGGVYGRGMEWSATSGAGYPYNVQISNNTTLDLGYGGTGTARQMAGSLAIDSGSTLSMDINQMTQPLKVLGGVTINGTLTLSGQGGGDIEVGGSWMDGGTFNSNGRQVAFNGSGAQSIDGTVDLYFDYLLVDNSGAGVATLARDITVRRWLKIEDSEAELSAGTSKITMQGDAGSGPLFWNRGTFNAGTGTVEFIGGNNMHGRVWGASSMPLVTTFYNVTLTDANVGTRAFGVDFYDQDAGIRAHIAGTLTLNQYTFVASEEDGSLGGCGSNCDGTPTYDSGSTLRYNNSASFSSGAEWWPDDASPTCGSDKGMPYNVILDSSTTVDINAAFANNGQTPNYGASSNKTACGSVTINSGTALLSTAGILSVRDDWTRAGTFTHNNGTVRFNGSGGGDSQQTVTGDTTFYNLTVDPSSNKVYFGTTLTTIVHDLSKPTSGGGIMDPGTGKFSFIGTPSSILGDGKKVFYDLEITSGTTNHSSGDGDIYIHHDMVNNGIFAEGALYRTHFDEEVNPGTMIHSLSGSGTTTFGLLEVWTEDTLNAGTHSFTVVGAQFWVAANATFNGGSATVTFNNASPGTDLCGAGAYNFNHLVINTGAVLLGVDTTTNSKTFHVAGNWTNNGTYTHNSGAVHFNGTSTIGGTSVTSFFDILIETACNLKGPTGGRINVAGNWTNNGTFDHGSGAVYFNGTSTIAGTAVTSFFDLYIEPSCSLTGPAGTVNVAHNWTNNGTYNAGTSIVACNGSTPQVIGGTSTTVFSSLTINNAAGVSLGNSQQVNGTLLLSNGLLTLESYNLTLPLGAGASGTFGSSRMVVTNGTGSLCKGFGAHGISWTFPIGDNTDGADYSPARLVFWAVTSYDQFCVRVTDAKHPNNPSNVDYLTRYWTVTTQTTNYFSCDATFTYVRTATDITGSEANILEMMYHDGTWTYADPVNGTIYWTSLHNFSDFTGGSAPTAVDLTSFAAAPHADGVLVSWETASERDNVGFYLYRSTSIDSQGERLNDSLIPSRAPGNGEGASYEFLDPTAMSGMIYYYTLEDIDASGNRTAHGPISSYFWRVYLPLIR